MSASSGAGVAGKVTVHGYAGCVAKDGSVEGSGCSGGAGAALADY